MLDRTDQIRCAKGIVDDERQTMFVSDLSQCVDIRNIGVRVTKSFNINCLCIRLDSILYLFEVVGIYEGSGDTVQRQCVCQKVGGTTVDGLLSYNVLTLFSQCLDSICNRSCTCSYGKTCNTTLQSSDTILKYALCGAGQTTIDITCISQTEAVSSVLGITEYIGSCLVDRYGSCIGCRIRIFLSYMQL